MKSVIALTMLLIGFIVEAQTMSLMDAKTFLIDEAKGVDESGVPACRTSQDLAFLRFVAEDWKRALTLLENDAPDLRRQHLIVAATGFLSPQDYVRFLSGACDLMELGKLKMPGWAFCFGSRGKDGFLGYNYDQPEVATLISRMEAIYKVQEPRVMDEYFSSVKSGEAKKLTIRDCTNYGIPMPDTYTDNSKGAYQHLLKEQKRVLAEETNRTKGKVKPEPTPRERKIVRMVDEDGSVRITEVDVPPEDKPIENKAIPWKWLLIGGTLVVSGAVVVWQNVEKRKKARK